MTSSPEHQSPPAPAQGGVFTPPNNLKARFGAAKLTAIDPNALAKAEAALKSLSGQFGQWLQDEVGKLEAARAAIKAEGMSPATAERLYIHAHDLKGLGTTYEYPLISRIAGSLCKLMDEPAKRHTAPVFLIDAHVDAIRAAVRDSIQTADHPVGRAIAQELEGRVRTHLGDQAA